MCSTSPSLSFFQEEIMSGFESSLLLSFSSCIRALELQSWIDLRSPMPLLSLWRS